MGFHGGSDGKASACNAGDPGSIPGSGGSPGEGNGNPLQYSCPENPTDGEAWWAIVHGVAKSRTRLSDFTSLQTIKIVELKKYLSYHTLRISCSRSYFHVSPDKTYQLKYWPQSTDHLLCTRHPTRHFTCTVFLTKTVSETLYCPFYR